MIVFLLARELGFPVAEYPSHYTQRVKVAFLSAREPGFRVAAYRVPIQTGLGSVPVA